HGVSERLVIAGRHEESRLPVLDHRLQSADASADDRCAARHRLERHQSERLGERRYRAEVRGSVVESEIFLSPRADERDVRLEPVLVHEAPELEDLLGLWCVVAGVKGTADHEETDVAPHVGMTLKQQTERAQEHVDPLYLLDPTHEQDEPLALVAPELLACVGLSDRMEKRRI